jgi:hypothetical protein
MKATRVLKSMIVVLLLSAAAIVALVGIGCFGGGDESGTTTVSAAPQPGNGSGTLSPTDTTDSGGAQTDGLSTFNSKDPFIPQAQPATTRATTTPTTRATTSTRATTPTTRATTTTRSTTTTTRSTTTTTAPHQLKVTAFYSGPAITFTLDGISLSHLTVGSLVTGGWGSLEVMAIDVVSLTNTVTFRRDGSIDFMMQLNDTVQW